MRPSLSGGRLAAWIDFFLLATGALAVAESGDATRRDTISDRRRDGLLPLSEHAEHRRQTSSGPLEPVMLPTEDDFYRKLQHQMTVIGGFLYIDGGQIRQMANNSIQTITCDSTISINLQTAWTPSTVTMKGKDKGYPSFMSGTAWTNPAGTKMYVWGGHSYPYTFGDPPAVMAFTPRAGSDDGLGSWAVDAEGSTSSILGVKRTELAVAARAGDTAFILGGTATKWIDPFVERNRDHIVPVPGLIAFNMSDNTWTNHSATGFTKAGTFQRGQMIHVPGFADASSAGGPGMLAVIGGGEMDIRPYGFGPNLPTFHSFRDVNVYDVASKKWHRQVTTGTAPSPRRKFCAVGAAGKNGTFEIFVYGGIWDAPSADKDKEQYHDVHILSLPGFTWHRATNPQINAKEARFQHSCVVAGNRQMISVGGEQLDDKSKDPWPYGLGVFDMVEMQWTQSYDPTAADYDSPKPISDWYQAGNLNKVNWASDETRALFVHVPAGAPPTNNTNLPSDGNDNAPTQASDSSGPNVGAIVGGVVGGVAAIGIIAALAFWLYRKRRRDAAAYAPTATSGGYVAPIVSPGGYKGDAGVAGGYYSPKTELSTTDPVGAELPDSQLAGGMYEARTYPTPTVVSSSSSPPPPHYANAVYHHQHSGPVEADPQFAVPIEMPAPLWNQSPGTGPWQAPHGSR